jgi:hypothetical protein
MSPPLPTWNTNRPSSAGVEVGAGATVVGVAVGVDVAVGGSAVAVAVLVGGARVAVGVSLATGADTAVVSTVGVLLGAAGATDSGANGGAPQPVKNNTSALIRRSCLFIY